MPHDNNTKQSTMIRRVAVVRNNFLPYSETFIHDELNHHVRYKPTVFCRQERNVDNYSGHEVISAETIPNRRHPIASAIYGVTGFLPQHEKAFRRTKFDIIHAHFGHNGLWGMGFALRHKLPLVVSLHGRDVTILMGKDKYRPEWWHYLLGHKFLFRRTTIFLAASTELKEIIVDCGCPENKVVVHRLGVDLSNFVPADDEAEGVPRVVMVGRFIEKKGHRYGLEAAAIARNAGLTFKLTIIGDGDLRPEYERIIADLKLEDTVDLLGVRPHTDIMSAMKGAAVVMVPSVIAKNLDRESGVIVAKEGSACGISILGTLHGGLPDIVDEGETGYLVAERDSAALGKKLIQLLSDKSHRQKMGAAARVKMENEYDSHDRSNALEDYYDDAIVRYRASRQHVYAQSTVSK